MATIKVAICEEVYPAPVDGEDYFPDGDDIHRDSWETEYTFRDLVDEMQHYPHPSSLPLSGNSHEWLSSEAEDDYQTGEHTIRSMHFADSAQKAKYWRLALIAAGFKIKSF